MLMSACDLQVIGPTYEMPVLPQSTEKESNQINIESNWKKQF